MNVTKAMARFDETIQHALFIPNSFLPENLRDKTRGGSTVERLNRKWHKSNPGNGFDHDAERKRRVEVYAAQVADCGEVSAYEPEVVGFSTIEKLAEKISDRG